MWRVGLMGYSSQKNNVLLFLAALEKVLLDQGFRVPAGAGVAAADSQLPAVRAAGGSGGRESKQRGDRWQKHDLSDDSECRRDERIHRRFRCAVESDGLRVSLPLLALLEWHRHAPRRHDGLQIFRGRQGRDARAGASRLCGVSRARRDAICRTAKPATSAPNIFANGWSRKTSTRSTTFPPPTFCASSRSSA